LKIKKDQAKSELKDIKDPPSKFDFSKEAQYLVDLINGELKEFLSDYSDPKVLGAGGTGIVLSGYNNRFQTRRAIKVPRVNIYNLDQDEEKNPAVNVEIQDISNVSHENITQLYDYYEFEEGSGHCQITEYVGDPKTLGEFAKKICCSKECRRDKVKRENALRILANVIYDIVDAVYYLHNEAELIHFDIKPDNILISKDGKPFIVDLGFARSLNREESEEEVTVGFTHKYSHPILRKVSQGMQITEDPDRAKNTIPPEQVKPAIDLFSFARTLQEILKPINDEYGETIHSHYEFDYLHFLACLCRDGYNVTNRQDENNDGFLSDQALGLPATLFKTQKFCSFKEARKALQRLVGKRRLEEDVPELDNWSSSTINVSNIGIATLTSRVSSIIEHPLMRRLSSEKQLGMIDTVFPTASHSRLQHSLGTYYAVCKYITALYHNEEDPTIQILFDRKKCEKALLAALIHDIGQSTFGHELEEVDLRQFSHEEIGEDLLRNSSVTDQQGRTIRELIEKDNHDCWGLELDAVIKLLKGESKDPFETLLHDILDNHLDADKLDYLVKDTNEARVEYGHGIDTKRFLRSLTTHVKSHGDSSVRIRLAIKRKGAASAEAFAFARYQSYQSIYWHHTSRVIKAMFITAAREALRKTNEEVDQELFDSFRSIYINKVINIPGYNSDNKERKLIKESEERTIPTEFTEYVKRCLKEAPKLPNCAPYNENRAIQLFWALSDEKSQKLLKDLICRRYYKRILEIPLTQFKREGRYNFKQKLNSEEWLQFREDIQYSILNLLDNSIQSQMEERDSLQRDNILAKKDKIARNCHSILIDLPRFGWTSSGDNPLLKSDYKRRHFRTSTGEEEGASETNLWSEDYMGNLMRKIATFRVYAEPKIHSFIRRVSGPKQIEKEVINVRDFPTLKGHD